MSGLTIVNVISVIVLTVISIGTELRNGRLERENASLRREVYKLKVLEDGDEERENEK